MPSPIVPLLLNNWQLVAKSVGVIFVAFIAWWFFVHNPKVIDGLEKDKAELQRQVDNGKNAIILLDEIKQGRAKINAGVQSQISTIRTNAVPRRAILIYGGGVLPALPPSNITNGSKADTTASGK